jgi:hypothetical protein
MPSNTVNPQSTEPEVATQGAVGAAGVLKEKSGSSQTSERRDVRSKSYGYARDLWKHLVKNVGEPDAREIMRHVMGDKKPGRPRTDQDTALIVFIYAYILRFGLSNTDGEIANYILESCPHYLQFASGAVAVANSDFTEAYMSSADDPVVQRTPVGMSLSAIKKSVERLRRRAIDEGTLAKTYAPRQYYRDQ